MNGQKDESMGRFMTPTYAGNTKSGNCRKKGLTKEVSWVEVLFTHQSQIRKEF